MTLSTRARLLLGCGLAASSGLLATVSFSPFEVWPLIFIAFVPMMVAQYRVLPGRWSALAQPLGVGGFLAGYLGGIFPPGSAWYMPALPLLVAVGAFAASLGERARRDRAGYGLLPVTTATTWVAIELLRLHIPALGTWAFLGHALFRQAWLIQPVGQVGIFGLDLLIMLVNAGLALGLIAWLDRRGSFEAPVAVAPRLALRWCGAVAFILIVWTTASLFERSDQGSKVRVAVLQPGTRGGDRSTPPEARNRVLLEKLSAQTRDAAARGARLVVWPEASLTYDPAVEIAPQLATLARDTGATLVVGYVVFGPSGTRNEAVTIGPDGNFVGRFGKDHPVSFRGGTSLTRGSYPTVETSFGTLGTAICADIDFTDTVRRLARRGAQIIAVPSADWPEIATKHYTHAVFRALESGAPVAKSEFSIDSAIVDRDGSIVASAVTPRGTEAVLVADVVPREGGLPLAARYADWAGWLCLGARVGLGLCTMLRRRAKRVGAPGPVGASVART